MFVAPLTLITKGTKLKLSFKSFLFICCLFLALGSTPLAAFEKKGGFREAPRALVAGGAGFLGTNLCRLLLKKGYQVICLDNLSTGKAKNIQDFLPLVQFTFINQDVMDPIEIEGLIDEVYNLACPASPPRYQNDPIRTLKINFLGTLNLLNFASTKKARFLQASTSEVYGDPEVHPQVEEYRGNVNTTGPRACYDEGKRVAEALCYEFHKKGLEVKLIRIFNTYGPYMDIQDGRLVSNFIAQALSNQPLSVFGDGTQTRSLCYVEDLVDGIYKMMHSEAKFFGPVNLGNDGEYNVLELALTIRDLTESSSELMFFPLPEDDPKKRRPDLQRAKKYLKWTPKVDLKKGLELTISFFKAELAASEPSPI